MANETSPPPDHLHTIFVDTSIDTHLAMVVSLHDTICAVKVKIRAEHAHCFQDIGEIAIQAIKVRRRGFFYNLADSMCVLNAFDGVRGSWFVCIDAVPMCTVKNRKVLPNKVTHEHLVRHDYAVPVMNKLLARDWNNVIPSTLVEHENQNSVDASLKELPAEDGSSLQKERISPAQILQVCSIDELTQVERNIKTSNDMKVNEAHLHEGVAISPCEPEKNSGPDGQGSHNPIVMSIDHKHRPGMLIDQEKDGRRKDDCKNLAVEASDAMPSATCTHKTISGKRSKTSQQDELLESQSQHYLVEKKRGRKLKDGLHEEHLEDCRRGSKFSRSEDIDESNKSVNARREINCDGKKEILAASSVGLPSKLSHENTISLQNPPVEKHTKRRKRKLSKSHEEAHLAMPFETLVARSPQVTADQHNSGKEGNASIFSGKYHTEPNIDESLPNDDGDMSTARDTASFLEVSNQKEIRHSMEINKEAIEEQILQVNPEDQSEKHVNSGGKTNVHVSLKEPEEAKISSQVASGFLTKLYCSTEGLPSKLTHENTVSPQNPAVEKHTKKRKRKSSKSHAEAHLAMPSETLVARSPQVITADQHNSGKEANASIFSGKYPTEPNIDKSVPNDDRDISAARDNASFLEVAYQKEIRHSMEKNKEPIEEQILQVNPEDRSHKLVNLGQESNVDVSFKEPEEARISSQVASEFPTKLCYITEGLPSKLPHENTISPQNPAVEKHTKKKKKKSSKSHEEAHLAMPSKTVVARSPQVTADPHNSGKEANASIFSGKYPTEPNIDESLSNDDKNMSVAYDTACFPEVANLKEIRHSMEINEEPIEQILQVNPEDRSEKLVNSGKDTNVDASLKEPEKARNSSLVASELPTKLYCSTDKLKSQSSKILEPKEANDQQRRESDATKCITDLDLRDIEAGSVYAKAGISASAEKFPYQEQATNAVSNLKGTNKDRFLTKVDSKGLRKSQRSRKKSKAASRVCKSIELNGNEDHFNYDSAQVFLTDVQNESNAAKFIKQADQKASGGHSVDTMIKVPSSSKKAPNPDEVSDMNSGNPPISMSRDLSEVSNNAFVEQATAIRVPSQTSSEVQAKPRRNRKKSKSEPSKLGSQENCDVVLPKFNGEVTESNDGRGSDSSKLANESNQKIELHCIDAKVKVPLSDENSSKPIEVPRFDPLDPSSCKLQDLSWQSDAKIIIKDGHVTQYEALAGPAKSKCDRKKSKKEALKARVSSEMSGHMELCRPRDSTINFDDYFVPREGKHSPAVHKADLPSGKSETGKKNRTRRKTDINQPYQDSPTNLVQPSSHKQHMAMGLRQENGTTHHDMVDAVHDTATTDSKNGIASKAKNTKQSSKQNLPFGRVDSDSSLHKAHDKHKLDRDLQNYGSQSHVQLPKSGAMRSKQGKKISADGKGKTQSLAPDHGIDNMVSKDGGVWYKDLNSLTISNPVVDAVGSNNFDVSPSEGMATAVTSSDSTEDTPYQKRRYRVIRKIQSRKSKKITNSNPEKSVLASYGRIFSDASGTSSESENDTSKKKASIETALDDLSTSGDSDSHLEEVQTNASALKLGMDTNSSGAESDERGKISKEADGRIKNYRRCDASTQKIPLSVILKSSSSYRKAKLRASQSEFPDAEREPIDVVLETQPESASP